MTTPLHLTVAEFNRMVCCGAFDALDRKVELIRGELTQMNPAGPMHDDLIVYLTNWSLRSIDPAVTLVASQTGLDLPEQSSRPEPDLMWVRKARYRARHPRASDVQLAVEVAESSLSRDLEIKRRLYAEAGIMEYWIVDAGSRCVHVHRDPEEGEYRERAVLSGNDLLTPNCRQEAVLSLKELFEGE